ncbi:unnamed protein product [Amoebophrya sp. A120]|nr:unnamed protein product [Amoebophrya sp. A120]|eukprot:GSA120T00023217001.1
MASSFAFGAAFASVYSLARYSKHVDPPVDDWKHHHTGHDPTSASGSSISSSSSSRAPLAQPPPGAAVKHPAQFMPSQVLRQHQHQHPRATKSTAVRWAQLHRFSKRVFLCGVTTGLLHFLFTKRYHYFSSLALDRLKDDKALMNFADFAPPVPGMKPIPVEEMGDGETLEEIQAEEQRLLKELERNDRDRKRFAVWTS